MRKDKACHTTNNTQSCYYRDMLGTAQSTHRFATERAELIDGATCHPDVIIAIYFLFFFLLLFNTQLAAEVLICLTLLRLLSVQANICSAPI